MNTTRPAETAHQHTPPHGPGWIGPDNCFIHGYEPIPGGYYTICGECGHVYGTPEALRAAYRREIERITAEFQRQINAGGTLAGGLLAEIDPLVVPPAEDIPFCQECLHDF
jgi:hypothetical protein